MSVTTRRSRRWLRGSSRNGAGSMSWSRTRAEVVVGPWTPRPAPLDPALLQLVTEMNLFGTVYSCNAVAPIMKQQRSGKIVTVSSVAGTAPSADGGYAHYGAAKAAIAHYTRYLAQDLGPFGITVNWIAPGVIATGRIMATVIPGSSQSNRDRAELVALRRLGTVEDCAKVVEFLATDLSDYVTGAVIPIDGIGSRLIRQSAKSRRE
jgi:3-oxoacyl-[acyl-carrier protein] reductase